MAGSIPVRGPAHPRWTVAVVTTLAVAGLVDAWYLSDPDGVGGTAHMLATAACFLVAAAGPVVRGVRPRGIWRLQTASALFMFATIFDEYVEWRAGPFEYSDVVFLSGYNLLIGWLVLISRLSDDSQAPNTVLDTAAGCLGALLTFWVLVLAPLSTLDELITGVIWAAYPPLDIILLFLTVHLVRRHGRPVAPLLWFMGAAVLWFVGDSVYTLLEVRLTESYDIPVLEAVFLFAHVCLALSMAHPDAQSIQPPPSAHQARSQKRNRAAIILLTVSPALLCTAVPSMGVFDTIARTTLVGALLTILFVRLSRTVDALSRAEADSHHRATHDALTGLLNRPAMFDALEQRLSADVSSGRTTAVFFLDCNGFKKVNDTWGHHAGDTLLVDLAERLRAVAEGSTVARLGGDEFVVLASVAREAEASELAERIRRAFDRPLRIGPDQTHALTPAVGIALARPGEVVDSEELLGAADAAMYEAKQHGRGHHVLVDAGPAARARSARRVDERRTADLGDPFEIFIRPLMGGVGYRTRAGWEADVCWTDAHMGQVPPDLFVPTAEHIAQIAPLVAQALSRAGRHLSCTPPSEGGIEPHLSVRVTTSQLEDPTFLPSVGEALRDSGLTPERLWLEVDEWALLAENTRVLAALNRARENGHGVTVVDVGSGDASLSMLLEMPIDCVELDRRLVAVAAEDPKARRRLAVVMALVRSLGVDTIVADGVADDRQAAVLEHLGCPFVQGPLYETAVDLVEQPYRGARTLPDASSVRD